MFPCRPKTAQLAVAVILLGYVIKIKASWQEGSSDVGDYKIGQQEASAAMKDILLHYSS